MAFLGLGSFGQGFVKGFAESANEALKNDIQRINNRVEKVADFRVKRAVQEQEERKKEIEEIEEALREAEGLFGADDPRAASYAASLLKEQGSTSALKSFVQQIKQSDEYKRGGNLANFMQMSEKEMPTGTRSDYARAFLGKPKATPDYRLPEDAVTAGAGNLISALGLKPDISGRAEKQVSEQMAAMGVGVEPTTDIVLPSSVFQKEKFVLANKTPSERITYLNEELARVGNTPERNSELQSMLTNQYEAVKATGGIEDQITALESQLSRASENDAVKLKEEIGNLKREAKLRAAETSDNPMDLVDAKISIALREGLKTGDLSEYRKLLEEKKSLGKEPTFAEELTEDKQQFLRDVQNGTIKQGTPEYEKRLAQIKRDEELSKVFDVESTNPSVVNQWSDVFTSAIEMSLADKMPATELQRYTEVKKLIDANPDYLQSLKAQNPKTYQFYIETKELEKQVMDSSIARVLSSLSKETEPEAFFAAASIFGYGGEAQAAATQAVSDVSGGEAATQAVSDVSGGAAENDSMKEYPNDESGANLMIQAAEGTEISISDLIASAEKRGYGEDFLNALRNKQMSDIAIEDAGMPSELQIAVEAVKQLPFLAGRRQKVDAIMDATGVSKEAATNMLKKVEDEIKTRRAEDTSKNADTPVSLARVLRSAKTIDEYNDALAKYIEVTGRTQDDVMKSFPPPSSNKNSGGLMSRG
jgi:hypothetical protein